jgi:prephenate dehydrogenase
VSQEHSRTAAAASLVGWSQLSIVGLGLIGGSLARALRRQLPQLRLVGVERSAALPTLAPLGLVDELLPESDVAGIDRAFAASQVICLATPVSAIGGWLRRALQHPGVVTDCGSSKRAIAAQARGLPAAARFVPGHPMAGAGAARSASSEDLFEGRPWVLCPEQAEPAALQVVEQLVTLVGARPVHMTVDAHDRAVALTSHAPRLVASALMGLAEQHGALAAAGPAFERVTRGAGGSVDVWRDILGSNADEVARALRLLTLELEACAVELEHGSVERSLTTLVAAERAREAFDAGRGRPGG